MFQMSYLGDVECIRVSDVTVLVMFQISYLGDVECIRVSDEPWRVIVDVLHSDIYRDDDALQKVDEGKITAVNIV